MNLSPNFTLDELILSQTAVRMGNDNYPNPSALANLKYLARTLEVVRQRLRFPILISSGFRNAAVNKAVGGARNSAHMTGLAVDFTCPRFGPVLETAEAVAGCGIEFNQIIYEFGRWVHLEVPLPGTTAKGECLTIMAAGKYTRGLGVA